MDKKNRNGILIASFPVIGLLMFAPAPSAESRQNPEISNSQGETLYRSACSSCHGTDGRGAPQYRVGFDLPLPDFSDCSFASREPDSDWLAIAHDGGPARGFSELMPAFGEALSFGEMKSILSYIRSFCGNEDWPPGELNLPKSLVTEKAYPEDEAVYSLAVDVEGLTGVSNKIVYEKRFGARNQFELTVPFGWAEKDVSGTQEPSAENWLGGLGDIAVGVKRAFFHNARTGTIFSATGEIVLPTGDREKGFGKGTTVFEPFVSFGQVLPSEFFFQSQAGFELPADTDRSGREAFWRLVLGRSFTSGRFGRSWSPMFEVLAARELESGQKVQWDMVPQMQVTLNRRQHIMANVGVRLPLTDGDMRDTQLLFYLLWDWFDGGFFEGW
ncbi:MAG: transporter [Acidobacteria bacterium]|nr:transporter [Acidobacteriota bacterium]